jgi:hypothetical protein
MTRFILVTPLILAACNVAGGGGDNPIRQSAIQLAADRTCPLPVPERDTLLASSLLEQDRTVVDAFLAQRPQDPTAQAAAALLSGEPVVDPDQMACLAPYL